MESVSPTASLIGPAASLSDDGQSIRSVVISLVEQPDGASEVLNVDTSRSDVRVSLAVSHLSLNSIPSPSSMSPLSLCPHGTLYL